MIPLGQPPLSDPHVSSHGTPILDGAMGDADDEMTLDDDQDHFVWWSWGALPHRSDQGMLQAEESQDWQRLSLPGLGSTNKMQNVSDLEKILEAEEAEFERQLHAQEQTD